ncbi:lipopolysaccharide biosynthesis protein [Winogradskyella litoriviva]|uniref:Lipopolysaccharide biosynthesis protein n=1 Tax=Winogradskyella litoriviva TaxID=1220182 RepID=A0ABX2E438_9FLAO|nr:lipopolysaccharide biosynthesis protein [Winogradskyella litoriviva]NRD23240.1 lipopolysaccharide biosynthesis protein [Winogradskyella litoriviva]
MAKNSKIASLETKDLSRKSTQSGMINMGSQVISVVLQLASTIVLARMLSPDAYGLIGMVMAVIAFAGLFKDLGLSTATIQRKELNTAQVTVMFWVNVTIGLGLTLALALLSPLVVWFYERPELKWMTVVLGFNILIASLGAQHSALLNRNMQFKQLSVARIVSAIISFIVSLIGALYGLEHWALVLGAVSASFFNTLLVWLFSGWKPGLPSRNTGSREMIRYGLNLTGFEFVNYFSRNLDNVLIGKVLGSDILGYYSRAYRLIMFPISTIRTPLAAVALPGLSSLQNEQERFKSYYTQLLSILSLVTMPIATLTFAAANPIVNVVLGDKWLPVVPIMKYLAIAAFLQPVSGLFGVVLLALGHAKRHLYCGFISAIAISITFLVSVNYGVEVLAISYAITGYILFVPIFLYASNGTGITLLDFMTGVWRSAVGSISAAVMIVYIDFSTFFQSSFINLVIITLEFTVFYIVCIFILPGGKTQLIELLNRLKQAVSRKKE